MPLCGLRAVACQCRRHSERGGTGPLVHYEYETEVPFRCPVASPLPYTTNPPCSPAEGRWRSRPLSPHRFAPHDTPAGATTALCSFPLHSPRGT